MKTPVDEHSDLKTDTLWHPQPVQIAQKRCYMIVLARHEDKSCISVTTMIQLRLDFV